MVTALAAAGADLSRARRDNGATPLMVAASHGSLNAVKLLLSMKASTNLLDRSGASALDAAVKHGHTEVAMAIHAAGGQVPFSALPLTLTRMLLLMHVPTLTLHSKSVWEAFSPL